MLEFRGKENPGAHVARRDEDQAEAVSLTCAQAQSSQGVSASRSACLDRGAAPDAQARRRGAIAGDVERHAFLFQQRWRSSWRHRPWRRRPGPANQGSVILMQTEVLERMAASLARKPAQPHFVDPVVQHLQIGVGARDQALQAADAFRPGEGVEIIFHRHHRRRVDGLAFENAFDDLAALGHAEDLRHRPGRRVAFQPRHGAGRQHQHAVRGFAAQHLLPGEGGDIELVPGQVHREGGAGGVADGDAFAVGGNPVAVGHLHAARWCRSTETRVVRGFLAALSSGNSP